MAAVLRIAVEAAEYARASLMLFDRRAEGELEVEVLTWMTVDSNVRRWLVRLTPVVAVAGPTIWLAFDAGGFFATETSVAALLAALALLLWITLAANPADAISAPLVLAGGGLLGFAAWTLASGWWSDAMGRAVLEFDRALLYALVVVVFGLAFGRPGARQAVLWGVTGAGAVVCVAALATRVLPEVLPAASAVQADRLSYPVTYWNTLGLVAALSLVGLLHHASSEWERRWVRVGASALFPLVAVTLFFTFSRGSIVLVPVGVVLYLVLARPRALGGALIALLPATGGAIAAAYGADTLSTEQAASAAGAAEGRRLALILMGCALGAAVLRLAGTPIDRWASGLRPDPAARRRIVVAGAVLAVLVVGVPAAVADAPGWVRDQVDRFTQGDYVSSGGDRRDRIFEAGNNGRIDQWRAAISAFETEPLRGEGAGTYVLSWERERPYAYDVQDAHSLYAEVLGELGVVGLGLLLLALVGLAAGALRLLRRGPERPVAAAALTLLVVWAAHAGIDWDWEMPVVTLPVLGLAAACAAGRATRDDARGGGLGRLPRVVLGLGVLGIAVLPGLVLLSQRHLDASIRAFERGDCPRSIDRALDATGVLDVRAEPFSLLAVCDVRLGELQLAERAALAAVDRDPRNWRVHYLLALTRAAAMRDPRGAAREALRRNPRSTVALDLVRRFATDDPRTWRRRATGARLPF